MADRRRPGNGGNALAERGPEADHGGPVGVGSADATRVHADRVHDDRVHDDLWGAIDTIAARSGLTPSGLARRAGLNATTFNRSKRRTPSGRLHWPSTASILKVLDAVGLEFADYLALIGGAPAMAVTTAEPAGAAGGPASAGPSVGGAPPDDARDFRPPGFAEEARGFAAPIAGWPPSAGVAPVGLPTVAGDGMTAVVVTSEAMRPLYRRGDTLILAPGAAIGRGDRVLVLTADGVAAALIFVGLAGEAIECVGCGADAPRHLIARADLVHIARIVWASQ